MGTDMKKRAAHISEMARRGSSLGPRRTPAPAPGPPRPACMAHIPTRAWPVGLCRLHPRGASCSRVTRVACGMRVSGHMPRALSRCCAGVIGSQCPAGRRFARCCAGVIGSKCPDGHSCVFVFAELTAPQPSRVGTTRSMPPHTAPQLCVCVQSRVPHAGLSTCPSCPSRARSALDPCTRRLTHAKAGF